MTPAENRVLEQIDFEGLVDCLKDLIAIPSVTGLETPAQEFVGSRMASFGMNVDTWSLDFESLKQHPACSYEVDRAEGLGVVGILGEALGGRDLILNAHIDVVPAGEESRWQHSPWKAAIAGGRLYGRGAADTKGGLCCALFAAKAIKESGIKLRGRLLLESVIGEEDGGIGTLATILRGHRAEAAVVLEPTDLVVAPVQAGALNFRVSILGKAAHGAYRLEGVSAIEKFTALYAALMDLEASRHLGAKHPMFSSNVLPYPICVGTLRSGDWASSVSDWLTFEGRFGVAPDEDVSAARRSLEAAIADASSRDPWLAKNPPGVEWWGGQFMPATTPPDHPIVRTVCGALHAADGRQPIVAGMPYGADMRLLVNEGGIPSVLFGPGNVRHAHQPDEYVTVDQLLAATRTLALTAVRFCGHE